MKTFKDEVLISKSSKKAGHVLHHKNLTDKCAIHNAQEFASSYDYVVTQVALQLRRIIKQLSASTSELPSPVTLDALKKGQVAPPDILIHFFRVLYSGSEKVGDPSSRLERCTLSAATDVLYATTKGLFKSSKHICLGMCLKTMTGSKRVVEILNHFWHCINYHAA